MPFTTPLGYFEQGMTLLDFYFCHLLSNPNVFKGINPQDRYDSPLEIKMRDLLDVAKLAIKVAHGRKADEIAEKMRMLQQDVHIKDIESDVKTKEDEL